MSLSPEETLASLGITLPEVAPPAAAFVLWVRTGDLVFVSGHIAKKDGKPWPGRLGADLATADGKRAARAVAVDLLATLRQAAGGDLSRVRRIVKLLVLVTATPDYTEPHLVANGASELLREVFGAAGEHARSAFAVTQLPLGASDRVRVAAGQPVEQRPSGRVAGSPAVEPVRDRDRGAHRQLRGEPPQPVPLPGGGEVAGEVLDLVVPEAARPVRADQDAGEVQVAVGDERLAQQRALRRSRRPVPRPIRPASTHAVRMPNVSSGCSLSTAGGTTASYRASQPAGAWRSPLTCPPKAARRTTRHLRSPVPARSVPAL